MDNAVDRTTGLMVLRRRLHGCIGTAVFLIVVYVSLCQQLSPSASRAIAVAPAPLATFVHSLPLTTAASQAALSLQPPTVNLVTLPKSFHDKEHPDASDAASQPPGRLIGLYSAILIMLSGTLLTAALLVQSRPLPHISISPPFHALLIDVMDEDSLDEELEEDPQTQGATSPATVQTGEAPIQLLTDVDDTIVSSGGVAIRGITLGGVDGQFPRGAFYPGVFRFMLELAVHGCEAPQRPLPVAVLTARAREFLFALELDKEHPICRSFSETGQATGNEEWGIGDVMYGSVAEWVMRDRKGWRKLRNFRRLVARTCAERRYIFIGDTGEQDGEVGEAMLDQFPHLMAAVFLHVVVPGPSLEPPPMPADRVMNGRPVLFFRTYVGAALKAVQHGLMEPEGLRAVMAQACKDLETFESQTSSSCRWAELEGDLEGCEAYLRGEPQQPNDAEQTPGTNPA
eukprot:GGOE01041651.1.p1 GENE.GGOE01041651.1~~GGOE01041651.1.p1  ORF type:complete len:474 (+),score=117.45 GGOE01041651.1:54-1424(+)